MGRRLVRTRLAADPEIRLLGVKRRHTHYSVQKLSTLRLTIGDIVLAQCPEDHLDLIRSEGDLIVAPRTWSTPWSIAARPPWRPRSFGGMVVVAAFAGANLLACVLTTAFLMILTGCLSLREAYRSVDVKVLMLVIGTIALGAALTRTGAADRYAGYFLSLFSGASEGVVLSALIALTSLLSHFLSNNSTAVLMLPVAVSAAASLGVDARPFLVGICFGASACYASPLGYQTNLLVYGPGGYRFADFVKLGLPLNLWVWGMSSILIPLVWPFHP